MSASPTTQVACFYVGDHPYALDIMEIKEIINPVAVTPVPRAPEFIEGIIELRGAIMPVIDLRKRFGVQAAPLSRASKYVVVSVVGNIVGLVVDSVREVIRVSAEDSKEVPAMSRSGDGGFFSRAYKHQGRIIMMLDLGAVLSAQERQQLSALRHAEA
jgi:purine-binding chemotaxis protein CheW